MKFLQTLIKESNNAPNTEFEVLNEEDRKVRVEGVLNRYGDFTCYAKWLEVEDFEETHRDRDEDTHYITFSGNIENIVVAVTHGKNEYFTETYPMEPLSSNDNSLDWLQSAEVNVFTSGPGGNVPNGRVSESGPELSAMIEKMVRGFIASNWKKILWETFNREDTRERPRRGYPVRNDDTNSIADFD